eukprot:TRINITY_DN59552_c0_g1_i1.p2 TRINITY_DN59552_c0_g1~~TRINITY_DN59552_c0_g1_i1.p2  ORF type:complete len:105 (+),score=4.46 TRINITY_DN59552_c0_g1_i1:9-323(+)
MSTQTKAYPLVWASQTSERSPAAYSNALLCPLRLSTRKIACSVDFSLTALQPAAWGLKACIKSRASPIPFRSKKSFAVSVAGASPCAAAPLYPASIFVSERVAD